MPKSIYKFYIILYINGAKLLIAVVASVSEAMTERAELNSAAITKWKEQ